ncbi:MAG: AbrB family transcriptional regulator [Pseudomonadota bacterium]
MSVSPPWEERLSRASLRGIALGLLVGTIGGALADWAHVPLAWMLGALFLTMAASLAGAPVNVPTWLRQYFIVLLGLFLGESFDHLTLAELARWPISILAAILYVPVAGGVAYLFYRHVARESRATAICEAVPGGLTAVVLLSESLGADQRAVALSQSLRISIVVLLAPLIAFGFLGLPAPDDSLFEGQKMVDPTGFTLLLGGSVLAVWTLGRVGLPLPALVGPIFVSAGLRMTGLVEGALPHWLIEVALVVMGASIGSRFAGVALHRWAEVAALTLVGTLILMAVSLVFALAISALTGLDLMAVLLAYAPGGVAEMSLIALAIDADPGFVAVHHVTRIVFILVAFPLFAAWLLQRGARTEAAGKPGSD